MSYQVFFIDNGSTDGSCGVAERLGLDVYVKTNCNVGALRNYGACLVKSDIIVFLDADIEISKKWARALVDFIGNTKPCLIVTGAPCLIPKKSSPIERCWFNGKNFSTSYINSGNLITTWETFETVGGFDEKLKSGEDSDYCSRVKAIGGSVIVNSEFEVYHHGFPKSVRDFFKREMWHGEGDFSSFLFFFSSKPALLAVVNGLFLTVALGMMFAGGCEGFVIYSVWLFLIAFCMAWKRSSMLWQLPGNMVLSVVYLFGRLSSLFRVLTRNRK